MVKRSTLSNTQDWKEAQKNTSNDVKKLAERFEALALSKHSTLSM